MPTPSTPTDKNRLRDPVVGARAGVTVEIVPGQNFANLPAQDIPHHAIAELVPAGGGTFRPVARISGKMFTCHQKTLRLLNIPISKTTLIRLIQTGFIEGHQESPGIYVFDYESYLAHRQRCQKGDGCGGSFWTEEKRKQYSKYIAY